jgi:hypothetical protein
MKKQLARTMLMWVLYGFTLWFGFVRFGLPTAFTPMFTTFLGTSVFLGFALWETFIFMGMNDLRKDARDAELEAWGREFFAPLAETVSWDDITIAVDNGFQFEIWWNGAITMWQAELWDMTVVPVACCDRDVFVTKDEAFDWAIKVNKTLKTF